MLQAKLNNGNLIMLASLTRKEIETLRKTESFFCPTCSEQVIMKAGTKVIPHFAHLSNQHCSAGEYGEGPYHEKGKLLLYQWLKHQGLNVQLEKYIQEINQRPDLFVMIGHRRIAIEFQCARVATEQILQRNDGYSRASITPIWILGAKLFQRQSTYSLKVDQFTKQFIHQFSPTCLPSLYYFCPDTAQFSFFQDIYFSRLTRAIGKLQFAKLHQISLKNLFHYQPLPKKTLFHQWTKEKKSFRLTHPRRVFGREKAWYQWLYERGTHRELLPSIVLLPVLLQMQMHSPLWNWQSRICIDLIDFIPVGGHFSINHCNQILRGHWSYQTNHPLMQTNETAIRQYLLLLEKLQIIKQVTSHQFVKVNSIKFHKHIEDALESDRMLMNVMVRISDTKDEHNESDVRDTNRIKEY